MEYLTKEERERGGEREWTKSNGEDLLKTKSRAREKRGGGSGCDIRMFNINKITRVVPILTYRAENMQHNREGIRVLGRSGAGTEEGARLLKGDV